MSINAINSVSLYEYYYTINRDTKKKKSSPLADEMKEYGLTPTDNEQLNIAMLERAKNADKDKKDDEKNDTSYSSRPWADLMYQLGISFNPDPKDDIEDIKNKLTKLTAGVADEELNNEVNDLKHYVDRLYLDFINNSSGAIRSGDTLAQELNNISMLNQVNLK